MSSKDKSQKQSPNVEIADLEAHEEGKGVKGGQERTAGQQVAENELKHLKFTYQKIVD